MKMTNGYSNILITYEKIKDISNEGSRPPIRVYYMSLDRLMGSAVSSFNIFSIKYSFAC